MRDRRQIVLVRHGEREDNINPAWRATATRWDDPHLSPRGRKQADDVGRALAGFPFEAIYASPFSRTLQTMAAIVPYLGKHKVRVEPGLGESLNACNYPPGNPGREEQKIHCPYIDGDYEPVYASLGPDADGHTQKVGDAGCFHRIAKTIDEIVKSTRGNILIVSHGSPIAAAHLHLLHEWLYVGQCTISRVVLGATGWERAEIGSKTHFAVKDRFDLHESQSKVGETARSKDFQRRIRTERGLPNIEDKITDENGN